MNPYSSSSLPPGFDDACIRIFISGDRSHCGKSSIALLLLASLLAPPFNLSSSTDVAYIKPATQCESQQLIELYCNKKRVKCVAVGPIVYYSGFTRAHLASELDPPIPSLLAKVQAEIEKLAIGRKVLIIDGVGYPSVGSITGTCNATIASLAGGLKEETEEESVKKNEVTSPSPSFPCPVLLVSPSGVGNAIDSHNLNTTYFASKHVEVIGSIFNKLDNEGYYSLDNCKTSVTEYFKQYDSNRMPFGFVPTLEALLDTRDDDDKMEEALEVIDGEVLERFKQHVDVWEILRRAALSSEEVRAEFSARGRDIIKSGTSFEGGVGISIKKKVGDGELLLPTPPLFPTTVKKGLTRDEIEHRALASGSKGG